jgi:RNA polymerase sigma factor (TIGR02999 family)
MAGKTRHGMVDFLLGVDVAAPESVEVTGLLRAWRNGEAAALDRLAAVVYDELRRIARQQMRNERPGATLQTTALVNEVYLRLVDVKKVGCENRDQFLATAAKMMRRILVDAARARGSGKRGGGAAKVNVDDVAVLSPERDRVIVALDAALEEFANLAPRQAKVVELRYFGGLSVEQISQIMQTSTRTIERDWQFAKSWLTRELS